MKVMKNDKYFKNKVKIFATEDEMKENEKDKDIFKSINVFRLPSRNDILKGEKKGNEYDK